MPLRCLVLVLFLQQETAAFYAAAPPCVPALALGTLATKRPASARRCSAPALQEAKHRHKMQERRGGSGGAPRAQQLEWAIAQKLRGVAARHQQEAQAREGKRALLQTTRECKRSKAAIAASSSAKGMGFGGAPTSWRRLEQPGDGSARIDVSKVESLLLMRGAVLRARNYEAADELRGELARLGVAVRDEEMVWWLERRGGLGSSCAV